jgi:tRNA dimethylallyltransferase
VIGVAFIAGPTATGKSELAADVARETGAEIVSADAFQIYRGLDLLSAKPDAAILAKAAHHLIGTMSILEEMNAEKFRCAALAVIEEIHARGKLAIVVGGSGLYIKALTDGLSSARPADPELRKELSELALNELCARLVELDPESARRIDMKNRRRVTRALEICVLTGGPVVAAAVSAAGVLPLGTAAATTRGFFVFRDRDDLHARIIQRIETMFQQGVIEEVVAAAVSGGRRTMSTTASKMIGLRQIREHLAGKTSKLQCIAVIQQATRRYAKRQLTWFRHQTSFEPLNLSLLTHKEAVARIATSFSLVARE